MWSARQRSVLCWKGGWNVVLCARHTSFNVLAFHSPTPPHPTCIKFRLLLLRLLLLRLLLLAPVVPSRYPGGFFSGGWELKSWYVTVNAGALYSSGITGIKEGDAILCNMTRTGPTSWVVVGALQSDPKKVTTQHATNDRLKLQPWAYNTLECYGCSGCGTYPTKPITFTDNKLFQGGKLVSVSGSEWQINPKPAKKLECNEATKVVDNGDTTISFQ